MAVTAGDGIRGALQKAIMYIVTSIVFIEKTMFQFTALIQTYAEHFMI